MRRTTLPSQLSSLCVCEYIIFWHLATLSIPCAVAGFICLVCHSWLARATAPDHVLVVCTLVCWHGWGRSDGCGSFSYLAHVLLRLCAMHVHVRVLVYGAMLATLCAHSPPCCSCAFALGSYA